MASFDKINDRHAVARKFSLERLVNLVDVNRPSLHRSFFFFPRSKLNWIASR